MSKYIDKIISSRQNQAPSPDSLSSSAFSNWLETSKQRLRVLTYPSGYEADHTCYDGHAFYIASGQIEIKHDEEVSKWSQGDAFIIPDGIPHLLINPFNEDAKVIVVDHG